MRSWKRTWGVSIGGPLVDTLAYQFIDSSEYRMSAFLYYDFICRDFFAWMADRNEKQGY